MVKITVCPGSELSELTEPFTFSIIKCARENCHPQKLVESSVRGYYSFHLITHGNGTIEKDGVKKTLSRGTCFMLMKGESYRYYPDSNSPWSYIYIDFFIDDPEALALCGFDKDTFWSNCDTDKLYNLLADMLEAYHERNDRKLECEGYFVMLLSMLMRSRRNESGRRIDKRAIAEEAIIFINNNFRLPLTVEDVARSVGYSASYVSNSMMKVFGWSPIQYMMMFRIATACEMIQLGGKSLKEISAAVGYTDPFYFSRTFTKVKGVNPREYKKTMAKTDKPFGFLADKNINFR